MLELTPNNVQLLVADCCATLDAPLETTVIEAVRTTFHFVRAKLEVHRAAIDELLAQLPVAFRAVGYGPDAGGGWTFLNACERADGLHWGEHRDIDLLLGLGLAIGSVQWSLGRDMWDVPPGGMPYFQNKPPIAAK